jgi:hypothetical protein
VKQCFATTANIVDELEKVQVQGQLFLRNAAMGTQPGTEQRPKAFEGVDMHFMKAIAIFIAGIFPSGMIDGLVLKAPAR